MNRTSFRAVFGLALAAVLMFGFVAARGHGASAQDADTAGHPLVGTWFVDSGDGQPSITELGADGIAFEMETDGSIAIGAWEATGENTANLTLVFQVDDPDEGFSGMVVIRAAIEVDASGDTFTATFSASGILRDGTVVFTDSGEAVGTRFTVEGPEAAGTPLAGYPISTGEATPES